MRAPGPGERDVSGTSTAQNRGSVGPETGFSCFALQFRLALAPRRSIVTPRTKENDSSERCHRFFKEDT